MDPAKVEAIIRQESPTSVKGVQSFLGFANFYYTFIKGFSKLTAPLTALVRFDHERETVVETDASGWCIGGILLQRDDDGFLRPCAFYSKKMLPAECRIDDS